MKRINDFLYKVVSFFFPKITDSKKEALVQFIKFGFVGLSNTLLSYGIYLIVLLIFKPFSFKWDYIAGNLIAFFISVAWSFYWNNKYVFTVEEGRKRNLFLSLIKTYLSYAFTGILLTNVMSVLWVDIVGIPKEIAPVINLTISVPLNFLINKFWAFRTKKKEDKMDVDFVGEGPEEKDE